MDVIRYTLIADGSSDKALMNIIKWVMDDLYPEISFDGQYADFRSIRNPPPKSDIKNQIVKAEELYPFDVLFYHRDAESSKNGIIQEREEEVKKELDKKYEFKIACIIPIRMMEAWLLFDKMAIKKAAANRHYDAPIDLPSINKLETLTDPKLKLHSLLRKVSGLKSRNLKNFNVHEAVHLVAENIKDFSSLRELTAFKKFEQDLKIVVDKFIAQNN